MDKKDIKPLFEWIFENSEPKTVDRILVKSLPELLKENAAITPELICASTKLEVSQKLYHDIKETSEDMMGEVYTTEEEV